MEKSILKFFLNKMKIIPLIQIMVKIKICLAIYKKLLFFQPLVNLQVKILKEIPKLEIVNFLINLFIINFFII